MSEAERIIDAARSPQWGLGLSRTGQVMATRDSGTIGLPHVVLAERGGRGYRVSHYRPGDSLEAEGEVLGVLEGNPREVGRALRAILEDLAAQGDEPSSG